MEKIEINGWVYVQHPTWGWLRMGSWGWQPVTDPWGK